jgi:hypothetical protein
MIALRDDRLESMLLLAIGLRPASIQAIEAGGEFIAGDEHADVVRNFFHEARLPYQPNFVSIACFRTGDGLKTLAKLYAEPGGKVAILDNARVLCDIAVAAHDDIQDIAYSGWHERAVDEYARRFVWPDERAACVEQALLRAAETAKEYAEARIYRPLTKHDILRYHCD